MTDAELETIARNTRRTFVDFLAALKSVRDEGQCAPEPCDEDCFCGSCPPQAGKSGSPVTPKEPIVETAANRESEAERLEWLRGILTEIVRFVGIMNAQDRSVTSYDAVSEADSAVHSLTRQLSMWTPDLLAGIDLLMAQHAPEPVSPVTSLAPIVRAMVPLEVLAAQMRHKPYAEISATLHVELLSAIDGLRVVALAQHTPEDDEDTARREHKERIREFCTGWQLDHGEGSPIVCVGGNRLQLKIEDLIAVSR